jgi:hypothetical protein
MGPQITPMAQIQDFIGDDARSAESKLSGFYSTSG